MHECSIFDLSFQFGRKTRSTMVGDCSRHPANHMASWAQYLVRAVHTKCKLRYHDDCSRCFLLVSCQPYDTLCSKAVAGQVHCCMLTRCLAHSYIEHHAMERSGRPCMHQVRLVRQAPSIRAQTAGCSDTLPLIRSSAD